MVRVRIGEGWASDPEVRASLRADGPRSRDAAVRAIVDVLAVEVDGVDIGAGRTEGPVAGGVLALLQAVTRLAAGEAHASIPFEDGAVELVLHRRGGSVLASVVTLTRPARVLAHDVEVDLPRLAEAAREAARAFCERVAAISPGTGESPELRRLLRASSRRLALADAPGAGHPTTRSRRPRRRPREPACSFEIHDEEGRLPGWRGTGADLASLLVRGRVSLRTPAGEAILSLPGTPFLLFRDLCAAAERVAGSHGEPVAFAVARPGPRATANVEVGTDGVSVDGGAPVPCDPLAFAQAILEGAADFCAVVRARAPGQRRNALLAELASSARSALDHVLEARAGDQTGRARRRMRLAPSPRVPARPLAPGRLRKVSFRRLPSAEVGAPCPEGLLRDGAAVVACGREAVRALDAATGSPLWEGPGAALATLAGGLVVTRSGARLAARDLAAGSLRWERDLSGTTGARAWLAGSASRILAGSGGSIQALDEQTGAPAWSFTSPGALALSVLPLGSLAVIAADSGLAHALDPAGRVAWRIRGAGPLAAPPVRDGRACLLCFRTPTGATLASVDASSGVRIFEASLDFAPSGPPLRFAGRLAVPGSVGGDAVVAALEEDGSAAWVEPSPLAGPLALAAIPGGLLLKSADGSCAALDRQGRLSWSRSQDGRPAPPGNLPPVPARGVVVVPAEEVDVLDAATGAPVGRIPVRAPARLHVDADLLTWAVDAEGLVTGARLLGHLSVLERAEGTGSG